MTKLLALCLALCAGMAQGQDCWPTNTERSFLLRVVIPSRHIDVKVGYAPLIAEEYPEPIDVPAEDSGYAKCVAKHDGGLCIRYDYCKDPSRIGPLFDGNGKGHCLLFSK